MLTDKKEQSAWLKHVLIIEAIALALGIYLIATTLLISKDGILFINFAESMNHDAVGAMIKNYQHPGYPFLIYLTHGIIKIFFSDRFWAFIYSAQVTTLICQMGALAILYFIGRKFVGERMSFWAVLILTLMPESSQLGSDVLSDWPNLFVLSAGFLVLIKAFERKNVWLFGAAGLLAGAGYLIRPESAQLAIYALLWLLIGLCSKSTLKQKTVIVFAGLALIIGFAITAGPYMKLKGAALPKKAFDLGPVQKVSKQNGHGENPVMKRAVILLQKIPKGVLKLGKKICEVLVYFFAFFIPIGIWQHFKKDGAGNIEKFLIFSLVALNVFVLVWLFCRYGYLTRRHALPLAALIVFYVPVGIQAVANWIGNAFFKNGSQENGIAVAVRISFIGLIMCGLFIASLKLFRPLGFKKAAYREAAAWLAANTAVDDVIAVPDLRIAFYAKRQGIKEKQQKKNKADYVVRISSKENKDNAGLATFCKDQSGRYEIVVYKSHN